jgi:hypothetical protein
MFTNKKEVCMKIYISIFIIVFLFSPLYIIAKTISDSRMSPEKGIVNNQVNEFIGEFFDELENKQTEKIAWMIVEEIGYYLDESEKEETRNEYKANLDKIFIEPPKGKYGRCYGRNLINKSYLPGSNRYLRLYYISYHSGTPLLWEFRFYIRPKGELSLSHISWSEKNPFECFSSLDLIWEELKTNNELLTHILNNLK